ncbi:hypothetical protein KJ877_10525 [bacterium]|nr:hypothetical protein [bacterium]MBU1989190.1 hypothetical protein [bacterium]
MKVYVGIFVILLFITIMSFSYILLEEKGTFDKRYSFHFNTDSANSFSAGMPLKFSGFEVGVIDEIALTNEGKVFITFSVSEKNRKWISQGSVLMLQKPLIGSPHIELYSTIGNEPLENGSTIDILISDDINGMISKLEPVVDKIINIINSIDKISSKIAKDDSDLMLTLQNIKEFTEKIAKNDSLLTTITGDQNSTDNLVKSLNTTADIMQEVHQISKEINTLTSGLDKNIIDPSSSAIQELEAIMKDIKQKLDALDPTVKTFGSFNKDLLDIKEQISVGLAKTNQVMDKVDALMQDEKNAEVKLP